MEQLTSTLLPQGRKEEGKKTAPTAHGIHAETRKKEKKDKEAADSREVRMPLKMRLKMGSLKRTAAEEEGERSPNCEGDDSPKVARVESRPCENREQGTAGQGEKEHFEREAIATPEPEKIASQVSPPPPSAPAAPLPPPPPPPPPVSSTSTVFLPVLIPNSCLAASLARSHPSAAATSVVPSPDQSAKEKEADSAPSVPLPQEVRNRWLNAFMSHQEDSYLGLGGQHQAKQQQHLPDLLAPVPEVAKQQVNNLRRVRLPSKPEVRKPAENQQHQQQRQQQQQPQEQKQKQQRDRHTVILPAQPQPQLVQPKTTTSPSNEASSAERTAADAAPKSRLKCIPMEALVEGGDGGGEARRKEERHQREINEYYEKYRRRMERLRQQIPNEELTRNVDRVRLQQQQLQLQQQQQRQLQLQQIRQKNRYHPYSREVQDRSKPKTQRQPNFSTQSQNQAQQQIQQQQLQLQQFQQQQQQEQQQQKQKQQKQQNAMSFQLEIQQTIKNLQSKKQEQEHQQEEQQGQRQRLEQVQRPAPLVKPQQPQRHSQNNVPWRGWFQQQQQQQQQPFFCGRNLLINQHQHVNAAAGAAGRRLGGVPVNSSSSSNHKTVMMMQGYF